MKQKRKREKLLISLICLITLIMGIVLSLKNKVSLAVNVNDFETFKTASAESLLGSKLKTGGANADETYKVLKAQGQYGCLSHNTDSDIIDGDKNYVTSVYDVVFEEDENGIRKLSIASVSDGDEKLQPAGKTEKGKAAINLALNMATHGNMQGVYDAIRQAAACGAVVKDRAITGGWDNIVAGRRNT